jgi:O-antigen ligase
LPAGVTEFGTTRHQIWIPVGVMLAAAGAWLLNPDPIAPIAVAAFVLALAAAIQRPFLTCLAFIVLSFFRIHEAYPFLMPLHLPLLTGVLALGVLLWHMVASQSAPHPWPLQLKLFAVFFALVSIGTVFALDRETAFNYWQDVFSKIGLMTLAIAWLPRSARDFALAGRVFILSGILVALVAIYNKINGIGLVELTRVTIGRDIKSVLGDPNDLALILLFPLSFSVSFALHRCGKFDRFLAGVSLPIIMSGIIFTQSRGGLIGVVAVIAISTFRLTRSKLLLPLLVIGAAYFLYDAMGISGRVSGGAGTEGLDESASERLDAWSAAIQMALSRPFSGVGLANFAGSLDQFAENDPGRAMTSHSTWFGVLGETGFVGFMVFAAMVIASFRSVLRSHQYLGAINASPVEQAFALALLSGVAGFCAAGSFLTQGFTWAIYILVGLTSALAGYVEVRRNCGKESS